jgi:hypothetical protein
VASEPRPGLAGWRSRASTGRRSRIVIALAAVAISTGCAGRSTAPSAGDPFSERVARLQRELTNLTADADAEESRLLAEAAIQQSQSLAAAYRLAQPPILHNLLVNVGVKKRGLCWHWTEDLLARLGELSLPSYELHWGTAYRGELFREHNSVIVTARGRAFATGIVLDPWRASGELYWAPVSEDSYSWEPHRNPSPSARQSAEPRR